MRDPEERYGFGRNWQRFVETQFSAERVAAAREKLLGTLRRDGLGGASFLDVGCGSGLHSLAALEAGASRVLSFDYDPDSVAAAARLRERSGAPAHWEVRRGSVLDGGFMRSLGAFDVVYAWGVLHHTGDVWGALANARLPLAPDGVLLVALYSRTTYEDGTLSGKPGPERWLAIKRSYNRAGPWRRRLMEWAYVWHQSLRPPLLRPWRVVGNWAEFRRRGREYVASRGMEIWTDVRDWLGGWPMEFVGEIEVGRFAEERLGLELLEMHTGEGNTEFVLAPRGAANWWGPIRAARRSEPLGGPLAHAGGFAWTRALPGLAHLADTEAGPRRSTLRLHEDGRMLAYAHASPEAVARLGAGRYRHAGGELRFSTSDNSDPRSNGRAYRIVYEP